MKYYLAGPMSGRPQFNYPLFDSVSWALRNLGYDITSPAEMDVEEVRAAAMANMTGVMPTTNEISGETWGDFLSRDVKLIADTLDAIILLPEWETSKGARLEAFVSVTVENPAWTVDPSTMNMRSIDPTQVMDIITKNITNNEKRNEG